MKIVPKVTIDRNINKSAAAPKAVAEPKPAPSKKRADRRPPVKEVKIETTPEVVSTPKVEEPEILIDNEEVISNDIKEILANSEV